MLEFREIERHNFRDILKLSTTESQKFFVATNACSLSQAYAQPECVPLALYDGDTPVGFTMYGLDVEDTEYWIYRLMIDQHRQSKGYGRQALAMVLERIRQDKAHHRVYTSAATPTTPGAGPCTRVWASAPTAAWSTGRSSISWCGNRNALSINKRKRAGAVPTLFFRAKKKDRHAPALFMFLFLTRPRKNRRPQKNQKPRRNQRWSPQQRRKWNRCLPRRQWK